MWRKMARVAFCESEPEKAAKMDTKRSKITCLRFLQRFIYIFGLFVLILILLVQTFQCLRKFYEEPTFISTDIVQQHKASFPAMTFCPEGGGYKDEVLQAHGIDEPKLYNGKGQNLTWKSATDPSVSPKELFKLATVAKHEIFEQVYIRFFKESHEGKTNKILTWSEDDDDEAEDKCVVEQRHRSFGRCYTLCPIEWMRELGVYYIRMRFKIPIKVYLHRNHQFLDLSGRMGYKVYLNETVQSQVSYEDIEMLPRMEGGEKTCSNEDYDECMYGALERHMMEAQGCVVPWIRSDKPVCTDPISINTTFNIAWDRVTNQKNDCHVPCRVLPVTVGGKNVKANTKNLGELYFYYAPRVMRSKEHYFYTFLSLMAEIGGYVGLLLGVSFFHFAAWASELIDKKVKQMDEDTGEKDELAYEVAESKATEGGSFRASSRIEETIN